MPRRGTTSVYRRACSPTSRPPSWPPCCLPRAAGVQQARPPLPCGLTLDYRKPQLARWTGSVLSNDGDLPVALENRELGLIQALQPAGDPCRLEDFAFTDACPVHAPAQQSALLHD